MVTSTSNRSDLKKHYIAVYQEHLANRSKMQVYKVDKATNMLTTFEFRSGSSLVMISQRVSGVTPEMFEWYQNDMPRHLPNY